LNGFRVSYGVGLAICLAQLGLELVAGFAESFFEPTFPVKIKH
jgi:hypothetical protein